MSRVFGFKTVLAGIDDIPVLIFDEIDVGISGRIASVVGEKMSSLSIPSGNLRYTSSSNSCNGRHSL